MPGGVSWITEIYNNTDDDYGIWCWDDGNEGEYRVGGKVIGKNDGGVQVKIPKQTRVSTSDHSCGVPDGGSVRGQQKRRVIYKWDARKSTSGDPGIGLRLNRVMVSEEKDDMIRYMDSRTGREFASIDVQRNSDQSLIIRIEPDRGKAGKAGIFLDVFEQKQSGATKARLFGEQVAGFLADLAPKIAELALEAAKAGLMAAGA